MPPPCAPAARSSSGCSELSAAAGSVSFPAASVHTTRVSCEETASLALCLHPPVAFCGARLGVWLLCRQQTRSGALCDITRGPVSRIFEAVRSSSTAKEAEVGGKWEGVEVCVFAVKLSRPRTENTRRPPDKGLKATRLQYHPPSTLRVKVNSGALMSPSGRDSSASPPLPSPKLHPPPCRSTIRLRSRQLRFHPDAVMSHRGCFEPPPHRKEEEIVDLGHLYP